MKDLQEVTDPTLSSRKNTKGDYGEKNKIHTPKKAKKYFDSADWAMNLRQSNQKLEDSSAQLPHRMDRKTYSMKGEENKENYQSESTTCVKPSAGKYGALQQRSNATPERAGSITTRPTDQPKPASIVAKKRMSKSRKYFDSADWALQLDPSSHLHPKLCLLQSS